MRACQYYSEGALRGDWQKSFSIWPFKLGPHSFSPVLHWLLLRACLENTAHLSIRLAFNIIFINSMWLWVSSQVLLISTWSDSDLLMTTFQAASSCYYIPIDLYNKEISCNAHKSMCIQSWSCIALLIRYCMCIKKRKAPWHCTMQRKTKRSFEGIYHPVSLLYC